MNLNWLNPFNFLKWITERRSSHLRDHVSLLQAQKEELASQKSILESSLKKIQLENDNLNTLLKNCKMQTDGLHKEIEKLNKERPELKDQRDLENQIWNLSAKVADLEAQLRIKSIGF